MTALNADGSTIETVTTTNADGTLRSSSVTTTSANGLSVTTKADTTGDGAYNQVTTVATQADGSVVKTVQNLNPDGSLVNQTVTATSTNGLSYTTQTDLNGDGTFDLTRTGVTVIDADGSTTQTVSDIAGTATTRTVVTNTSADGLSKSTQTTVSGQLVETGKQTTTLNADGSQSQTGTVQSGNGATLYQTITTTSADNKTVTIQKNIYGQTPWSSTETKAIQTDGSLLDTVMDYNSAGVAAAIAITAFAANGLSRTATFDENADGTIDETISDITSIGADGSKTETFTDTNATLNSIAGGYTESATIVTVTSANGLNKTVTTTGMNGQVSLNHSSTQTTAITADGSTITTDTETAGSASDVGVVTISRTGLSRTTQLSTLGNGTYDRTDQVATNLDGSTTQTFTSLNADGSAGEIDTINTSADGRTVTITDNTNEDGDINFAAITRTPSANGDSTVVTANSTAAGMLLNKETVISSSNGLSITTTLDSNGDGTVDETKTDVTVLNPDGSRTKTIIETDSSGAQLYKQVIVASADGLTRTTNTYGNQALFETATNVTVNNTDGTTTNTTTTVSASGDIYNKTVVTTSADGRTVTTTWDLNGDGKTGVSESSVTAASGVKTVTDTYYDKDQSVSSQTVTTTSANGRVITVARTYLADSTKNVLETTLVSADGSGSYSWTQQNSTGAYVIEANHLIDSNGVDHITLVDNGVTSTYAISAAQESEDLARVQSIYTVLLGRGLSPTETQTWFKYLTPTGLNVTQLASDVMKSSEFNLYYGLATNADLVELAYQNAFARQPSTAELNSWQSQLNSGSLSRAAFVADLSRIADLPNGPDQQFNLASGGPNIPPGSDGTPGRVSTTNTQSGITTTTILNAVTGFATRVILQAVAGEATGAIQIYNYVTGNPTDVAVNVPNPQGANTNQQSIQFNGQQVGQLFGSALGQVLGGNNQYAGLAAGSVLSAVMGDVGKALQESLTQNIDIGQAIDDGFASFGADLLKQVNIAGAAGVSSFLIAELDSSLGLGHSFGAQLFNSFAAGVTTKVAVNAALIAEGQNISLFAGVAGNIITSVSGFLGGYLAHEILAPQTEGGVIGSMAGSALGAAAGGTPVVTGFVIDSLADIGVIDIGTIGLTSIVDTMVIEGIASILLPGIGALIGALLGTVVGDWLDTLINGTPEAWTAVTQDPVTGHFAVGSTESKGGADTTFAVDEANAAVTVLNGYIDAIGGESVQGSALWHSYGYDGNTIEFDRSTSKPNAQALLDYGVITTLKQLEIAGGDMILKRAITNSTATTLQDLSADISVAQQYELYEQNKEAINLLIALNPQSAFAAGWVVTLARAHELGLDTWCKSDFYGGVNGYLQSLGLDKLGVRPQDVYYTINGTSLSLDINVAGKFIPTITIDNYANYFNLQQFADGMPDQTGLYGEGGNTFDSQGVSRFEHGKGGGDTFVYNAGYGRLEISETDTGASPQDILKLGANIAVSQVAVTYDSAGNLFITDGVTGDQIKLDQGYANAANGVDGVQFADGTAWTRAQLLAQATPAPADPSRLYDTTSCQTFDGLGKANYVHGLGGGDTFVYNAGYGYLEIDETDAGANPSNVLKLGGGLTAADLKVRRDEAGNLFIEDGISGDEIKLDNAALSPADGVQSIEFADGSTLTRQQLLNETTIGDGGATALYGTGGNVFDSKGVATYAHGKGGGDTFLYNAGYGLLEIDENDPNASANDTLKLGAGITAATLSLTTDQVGNLFLSDGVAGDRIKIDGQMLSGHGIQDVVFADGTTWTAAQLSAFAASGTWQTPQNVLTGVASTVSGTSDFGLVGNVTLYTYDSEGQASYAKGQGQLNDYIYNQGYGLLEINSSVGTGVLELGTGIAASQVGVTSDATGNLYITDGTLGDRIRIDAGSNLSVKFADGTSLSFAQLASLATDATGLYATAQGQTLDPGAIGLPGWGEVLGQFLGNDSTLSSTSVASYVHGMGGGDTFIFNQGYGYVEIDETDPVAASSSGGGKSSQGTGGEAADDPSGSSVAGAGNNVLRLGAGITTKNLVVTGDEAGNIFLSVAGTTLTHDEIKLDGELSDPTRGVQSVVFADGTTWSRADLIAQTTQAHPDDRQYGAEPGQIYDSQGYSSYIHGLGGGDTFIYKAGYGALEIDEADNAATPNNELRLEGMTPAQVSVKGDDAGNLFIADATTGDSLKLDGQQLSQPYGLQSVVFDDGTVWTRAELNNMATTGSSNNTNLNGGYGNTYNSEGAATFAHSLGGGSTFLYDAGHQYNNLDIDETDYTSSTPDNVLKLGPTVSTSQVQVTADSSGSLTLTILDHTLILPLPGDLIGNLIVEALNKNSGGEHKPRQTR